MSHTECYVKCEFLGLKTRTFFYSIHEIVVQPPAVLALAGRLNNQQLVARTTQSNRY